jgi:hypothetical protein
MASLADLNPLSVEFLQPLVQSWLNKIDSALTSPARSRWAEVADECTMFYARSAAAMWSSDYSRKFWKGVPAPKFQFTVNKAFELVAVFGPNLLWDIPHRTVKPKRMINYPQELLMSLFQDEQALQQAMQQQSMESQQDKATAYLMECALNYFAREQPGGGLGRHSKRCVVDALLTGRGCSITRPYSFHGSNRTLVGTFRIDPRSLLSDPDQTSIDEAKWIAIKHVDPYWEVERRFQLEPNSLRGRASLESSWTRSESATQPDRGNMHRQQGITNELVVWWEIYSKTGPGTRMSNMQSPIREHLEETVGDYAYIAISANVPFPLNCPAEKLRRGATDAQVKQDFSWPVPLWADERWPVEVLDFFDDPEGAYPIAPMAPGLGELKFMNHMMSWLANRIYSSSRDFWAVAGPHVEHYREHLTNSLDQGIIPTPLMVDDVRKAIMVLQQPETRMDSWRILEQVADQFQKATGLTEFAYGLNEGGTQDRTAETTLARSKAVGARPEMMQKSIIEWQSNIAAIEAFLARWFVTGEDLQPKIGQIGRQLWEKLVMSSDVEQVVRQMTYEVSAASVRRPNLERSLGNFNSLLNSFAGVIQSHAQSTGNFSAANALLQKWGELHDEDMEGIVLEDPQPDPQQAQMAEQQAQMEMQRIQSELQKAEMELQRSQSELQAKMQLQQLQMAAAQQQIATDAEKFRQQSEQEQIIHLLEMVQDQERHVQEMRQQKEKHALAMQMAKKREANKPSVSPERQPKPQPRAAA